MNPYLNGNGHLVEADMHSELMHPLEEPVQIKGFSVTYDRKFNLGNFESLNPAITIWVKTSVPEGSAFDLHHARERVRQMARENVRAQRQRFQGSKEVVLLSLQPPLDLSITHKLGLFFNKIPISGNILQSLPATPDNYDAGFAISLATQKAAELGNPAHRLAYSRHGFG